MSVILRFLMFFVLFISRFVIWKESEFIGFDRGMLLGILIWLGKFWIVVCVFGLIIFMVVGL